MLGNGGYAVIVKDKMIGYIYSGYLVQAQRNGWRARADVELNGLLTELIAAAHAGSIAEEEHLEQCSNPLSH